MANDMEVGKIYTLEYLGLAVLIIPEAEWCGEDVEYDEAVWHIDLNGQSGAACGYNDVGGWLECTRIAPVKVCRECLRLEREIVTDETAGSD
jgi:hypothetical protein